MSHVQARNKAFMCQARTFVDPIELIDSNALSKESRKLVECYQGSLHILELVKVTCPQWEELTTSPFYRHQHYRKLYKIDKNGWCELQPRLGKLYLHPMGPIQRASCALMR